jgi:hypothetical protein
MRGSVLDWRFRERSVFAAKKKAAPRVRSGLLLEALTLEKQGYLETSGLVLRVPSAYPFAMSAIEMAL